MDRKKPSPVATIRATCPSCGDVELTPGQVQVLVCSDDNRASYAFRCPECHLMVSKPTDTRVVDILLSSGVRLVRWDAPAELSEPHHGDPISWDDILELHLALGSEEGSARALAELRGPLQDEWA